MYDMFRRMHVLLNELEALGQNFCKTQRNLKLLGSMTKIWEPKTTTLIKV